MNKLLSLCFLVSSIGAMHVGEPIDQIIDALHISSPGYQSKFSVMTYNVNCAVREERFEETKWNNREARVTGLIKEANPDIVCLQELRELPGTRSVNRFLSEFDGYRYTLAYRNPSAMSFGQATLYKHSKFFAVRSGTQWLSDTPDIPSDTWAENRLDGFGSIVQWTVLRHVKDGKIVEGQKPLWVFNVHFGLEEEVKTRSCRKLLEIVRRLADRDPSIVCGDFNFFPDKDGDIQRAILTAELVDQGKGARTLGGKQVEGTFIGYEHDPFKADLKNMQSRLDHIFSSPALEAEGSARLYTKTMLDPEPEELTARDYPSDHLPLLVVLKARNIHKRALQPHERHNT